MSLTTQPVGGNTPSVPLPCVPAPRTPDQARWASAPPPFVPAPRLPAGGGHRAAAVPFVPQPRPPADAGPPPPTAAGRPRRGRVLRLLAAERIKLTSTRSLWWCGALAVVLVVGMMSLVAALAPDLGRVSESVPYVSRLGYPLVLVIATLAITGDHRYGTLRTTFLAAPRRMSVLVAKAVVVAAVAGVVGLVAAFGSWAVALLVVPGADGALSTPADWRAVAGVAATYAVTAVIGVGLGALVRHAAGAVAILLGWLMVEIVAAATPPASTYVSRWLPFTMLNRFTSADLGGPTPGQSIFAERALFGPWAALAYAAGVAAALLVLAVMVTRRRDA